MSQSKILLRALPNVEFVHGYPGIPATPDRPQATIRGTIEVRLGSQPVRTKWIKVELRKVETIPGGSNGEEFIDFVGQSPMTVWQAQEEDETLTTKDLPFNIRVPETIPPSVALGRGAGIKYEVVATLCMKGKKGLFRREASTTISHAVPVVIDKHELHSTWPVYAQPESRQVTSDGLTLIANRSNTCFAPADHLGVIATLKSDNLTPVVLRGFEFSLRETIVYRAGPQSHGKKHGPQVHMTLLGEQKVPVQMTLYGGTQQKVELGCVVPTNHTTSSVSAARHIDIAYTINIKAILDKSNPISMDLPVTITNWPRNVSNDMIRRIGTAPNLSLTPPGGIRPPLAAQPSDFRSMHGPPNPPPTGGLPNTPGGRDHKVVPPGALVSGPPGSPLVGNIPNGSNPYSHELPGFSTQLGSRPPISGTQQVLAAQSQSSLGSGSAGGHAGSAGPEKSTFSSSDFGILKPSSGAATEFGSRKPGNVPLASTTTSRQSQSQIYESGVIDVKRRSASLGSPQVLGNEPDVGGGTRTSYHSQADVRPNVPGPSSSIRRPRAMSRTLQIVNATEDIPEDDSPVKPTMPNPFHESSQSSQQDGRSNSPIAKAPSNTPWPTAEDEKQRLFNQAKARAEKVQAQAKNPIAEGSVQGISSQSTGRQSPSLEQSTVAERPRAASPSSPRPSWPTAEDEKRRMFEQAQAKVRRTQAMAQASQSSPANGSGARLTHHRTASAASSVDSSKRPYVATSPPTISAGAALYSHAIASMKSPTMTSPNHAQASSSLARMRSLQASPSSGASSSVKHSTAETSSSVKHPTAEEEKSAIRYREARKAVERRLKEEEEIPQESPIAYDALFPSQRSNASSPPPTDARTSPLSEKDVLRRAFEARDAAIAANQPSPPAATLFAIAKETQPAARLTPPPPTPPASEPLSEKEVLRRAFEARDAAMMRSGQAPPAAASPVPSVSPQPRGWGNGSASSHSDLKESVSPWERGNMRTALGNHQPNTPTQQGQLPPEYDIPPPAGPEGPPSFSSPGYVGGGPLTAAEEKAQLKARYAEEDAGPESRNDAVPTPVPINHPSSPTDISHKSESSETYQTYLRRDPTISAGKKRASQMTTPPPPPPPPLPPPLLPRPPAEYIEETKLEDMKNSLSPTIALPTDFLAPLDFGFSPFGSEHDTNSSASTPPLHSR